jgi:hypothetical protein
LRENQIHDLIIKDINVKISIMEILNLSYESAFRFIHEDRFPNGMIIDFTLIHDNEIAALIEVKGDNINTTDFVRGLGQVQQYNHFIDSNLEIKGITVSKKCKSILLFPTSVLTNSNIEISTFIIPEGTILVEINEKNGFLRIVDNKLINKLKEASALNLTSISSYYIRDNRIYELYILLHYLMYRKLLSSQKVNRKDAEMNFLRKINTHNNRNWRNAFITLSSLGLIDSLNLPTKSGMTLVTRTYEEFATDILFDYIEPYVNEIMDVAESFNSLDFCLTNDGFSSVIRTKYGAEVLFLTESNNRYMSSWLNLLRDDYGCIDFKSRTNRRKIIYNPTELNKKSLIKRISKYSVAFQFIERYQELLGGD